MSGPSSNTTQCNTARREWLVYVALAALALLAYAPSLNFGFVWDDYEAIVENFRIQGLTAAHWRAMWLYPAFAQYSPLHHTALALLYGIGELNPAVYHAAQILLHTGCVVLLYALLKRLEGPQVAAIAAALFAVHPANVENVAWATEIKSTLALLLFLLSFICLHRALHAGRRRDAAACVLFFVLSILTKASTIVGPVVVLLYMLRERHALGARAGLLAALFAACLALVGLTMHFQAGVGDAFVADRLTDATLLAPGAQHLESLDGYYGGRAVHWLNIPGYIAHHTLQTIWPARLSSFQMFMIQPAWNLRAALLWGGLIAALALIAWLWFAARQRATAFWMMWFLGFLAPVLQLARNPIWVADRYLYIPAIGVFVLCGYLVAALRRRIASPQLQRAVLLIPVAAVVACLWLTTRYLPTWKSNVALWSGAMRTCSGSAYCHDMLGFALRQEANDSTGPDREQTRARLRAAAIEEATISTYLRPAPQKFMRLGDALLDAGDARAFAAYARAQEMMGQLPRENWAQIIKGHYRLGNLPEADRLLSLIRSTGADNPTVLLVQAFVDWKMGRPEQAREAIQKILDMNRLFPAGPDRTRRFVAHYWGDEEEAARMLREVGAP